MRERIERGIPPVEAFRRQDGCFDDGDERVSIHDSHRSWYDEVKTRVLSRHWTPDRLRILCSDPRIAARENTWLRKGRLGKRADQWRVGEFIRALDQIEEHPPGTEFRIAAARQIEHSDHAGQLQWRTAAGKQLELQLAIIDCPVQLLRLQPTTGGDPTVALVDLPGTDQWRQRCQFLRQGIRNTNKAPDVAETGRLQLALLQQQVARVRPAAALTFEQASGRQFDGIACPEVPWIPEQALEVMAMARKELIVALPNHGGRF